MAAASLSAVRGFVPRGSALDDDAFRRRHRWLHGLLGVHLVVLLAFGLARDFALVDALVPLLPAATCGWVALRLPDRRTSSIAVAAGLALCSEALVYLSGGAVEARFHVFVVLVLVALYQDWIPLFLATALGAAPVSFAGDGRSGTWAAVSGSAVLAACVGQVLVWRATELEQRRAAGLAAELARTQSQVEARESVSELFVNLARRNQALLDRQIDLIVTMQEREADPDQLAELFQLDHLATRIRRNAESLLVLSGEEPARRWGRPVALADVARAAVAEVEDYRRTDIAVDETVALAGRAVADVAHLLAELVENGLQFSPPESRVRVSSMPRSDGGCVVTVEDRGIGMSALDLSSSNDLLARPPEVDLRLSKRLGFHVASRLAARYQLKVSLAPTPGGGVTATVAIPADLLSPVELTTTAPPAPEAAKPAASIRRALGRPPRHQPLVPTVAGRPLLDPATLPVAARTAAVVVAPAPAMAPPAPQTSPPAPAMPPPVPAMAPPAPAVPPPPRPRLPRPVVEVPAGSAAARGAAPDGEPVVGQGGLTKRVPQASINPAILSGALPESVVAGPPPTLGRRSPDEVRSMLSRFQSGQHQGRVDAATRRPEGADDT